jgi:ankyrin repeat protein
MKAAYFDYFEIVQALVSSGSNVNLKNNAGYSALDVAILKGHIDIVKYLKSKGAK